jgi:hypothetical protein
MRLFSCCLVLVLVACQKDDERPGGVHVDCDATNCVKPPPGGGGGGDASVSDSTAPLDGAASTSITGSALILTSDDFLTAIPLTTPAEVRVEGASGVLVTTTYDGSEYALDGVKIGSPAWAILVPNPADGMATAQPLNTEVASIFDLVTVPGETLDLIYGLLGAPTTRDPGKAHIVLRFVDGTGSPLPGVSVSHLGETIAYDSGGTWSDGVTATGDQGFAIIANVVPGAGGGKQTFTFSTPTLTQGAEIWVEADTVTISDVGVL